MQIFTIVNLILGGLFLLCYAHQVFYVFYTLVKKPKQYPATDRTNRYAVLICARDEGNVLGYLLDSIQKQDYPAALVDVYVCADNCTDNTAAVARAQGAFVLERHDEAHIGKGYALDALLQHIYAEHGTDAYEAYIIVDADNLMDEHYITEMDKCCSAGHRIVAGYRNSKNFGHNWLASSYAFWFYHEARQLNNARTLLGVGGAVSGTGFLVHKDIFKRQGGWIHHCLIEDVEFSVDNLLHGEKVVYCHDAMVYDEHPTCFAQSWRQRLRWSKGYHQVIRHYACKLLRAVFTGKAPRFSCFDLLMNIAPAYILTTLTVFVNIIFLILCLILTPARLPAMLLTIAGSLVGGYAIMFFSSFFSNITERDRIHGTTGQRIIGMLTFPIFMMTFVLVGIAALFTPRVQWKPIRHTCAVSVDEVTKRVDR